MSKQLKLDDWEKLIVQKDGNCYFVCTMDFIDLQSSPAVFLDPVQHKTINEWFGVSPCPLIHLPLVELTDIIRKYNKQLQ